MLDNFKKSYLRQLVEEIFVKINFEKNSSKKNSLEDCEIYIYIYIFMWDYKCYFKGKLKFFTLMKKVQYLRKK